MAKYRKKPIVIEAFQLDHSAASANDIIDWMAASNAIGRCEHDGGESHVLKIRTLEGIMTASPGDWVIRGVKGEFYPCKPDIFAATYEPAS